MDRGRVPRNRRSTYPPRFSAFLPGPWALGPGRFLSGPGPTSFLPGAGRRALGAFLLLASSTVFAQEPTDQTPDPALRTALIEAVNDSEGFDTRFHAEVWLLDMATRLEGLIPDKQERLNLLRAIYREAKYANLPPELVLAVIQVESRFQQYAVSWAGARGLMQVMPFWVDEIGRPQDNLFDIDTNLRYGCTILRHYLDVENGDLSQALARYNGSVGEYWYPTRVQAALENRWYRR